MSNNPLSTGDISVFANHPNKANIVTLTLSGQIYGNISAFVGYNSLKILAVNNYTNLERLELFYVDSKIYGDITNLANLTKLEYFNLTPNYYDQPQFTGIYGDIAIFANMPNLFYIGFHRASVSGDIISVKNMTNLRYFLMMQTNTYGDISVLSTCPNIGYIHVANQTTGFINSLVNCTKLVDLNVNT